MRIKPYLITAILLIFSAIFTSCMFGGKERYVSRGEEHLKNRRFQEAMLEFRSAAQADKDYAPAHWGLARAYEGAGMTTEAIESLRRVNDLDPKQLDSRVKLGTYLLQNDPPQIEETDTLLRSIFAADPNFIDGLVLKAASLAIKNRPEAEVEDTLNKAIALDPSRVATYLSTARYFYKAKKNEKAEQTLNKAIEVAPASAPAYIEYGKYFDLNQRAPEAEAKFQKAVEVDGANLEARETLAQFYFNQNEFDKAEQAYKQLVEVQGNNPEARAALAGFYVAIDREDDAIAIYQQILKDAPESVFARYQLSEIFLSRNDLGKVKEQVAELLARDDKDMQALMIRARMNLQEGAIDDSIKDLEQVLQRAPNYKEALFYMADAKIRNGQVDHARTYISDLERYHPKFLSSRLLKIQASFTADEPAKALTEANELMDVLKNPSFNNETGAQEIERLSVAALTSRGLASMYLKNFPAAKIDLERVKELSPSSPGANINLGRLSLAMNDVAGASAYYEKALQLAPENFDALNGLINVFNSQKKFDASHERIDKMTQAGGSGQLLKLLPSLMFLKAQTFAAQGNIDAAEGEFVKAIETDPNYLPAYAAYASLLMDKKQADRALEQYQRVLQARPNDASTYALVALLEEGRNNTAVAETNYRKALELNPGMPIAANNLAWIIAESDNGNPDEALLYAKAAVAKLPNNPAFYDTLGWVYHKKGLAGPAVENLKKAVAMENAQAAARGKAVNPAYNLRLGIALASLGDKQNARREVETALRNERMLSNTEAQNAKNLLGTL